MSNNLIKSNNNSLSSPGKTHIPFKYSRAYQSNLKKGDPKFVKFEQQRQSMSQEQINNMIPSLFGKSEDSKVVEGTGTQKNINQMPQTIKQEPQSKMFPELNGNPNNGLIEKPQDDNFTNLFSKTMYFLNRLNNIYSMYGTRGNFDSMDKQLLDKNGNPEKKYDLTNTYQVCVTNDNLNNLISYGMIPEEFMDELVKEASKFLNAQDFDIEISDNIGKISLNTEDLSKALFVAKLFNQDSVLFWKFCEGSHIIDLDSAFIANRNFNSSKVLEPSEWTNGLEILKEMNGNV